MRTTPCQMNAVFYNKERRLFRGRLDELRKGLRRGWVKSRDLAAPDVIAARRGLRVDDDMVEEFCKAMIDYYTFAEE